MHTLLVCVNTEEMPPSLLLNKASHVTERLMPTLGAQTVTSQRLIPEIKGGWFYIAPKTESREPLISEFVNSRFAILVFGEVFQSRGKHAAEYVANAWKAGRIDAVRELDGCFSALIIDLEQNQVHIVCDLMGRRTLRYFPHQGSLLISTHDIPIVATGICPTSPNLESACSIMAFDFSLEGRSLLQEIEVCHPDEYVTWVDGEVQRIYRPLLNRNDRLDARDKSACNRQLDLMIEHMRSTTRSFCGQAPIVEADLTAGIDSRAVLGILLSVVDGARVRVSTAGGGNSVDMKTAQHIAGKYHILHNHLLPEAPSAETFLEHSRLLAFFMNGDTNSKRAAGNPLPRVDSQEPPHFFGGGGEIYRGYFYPSRDRHTLAQLTPPDIVQLLEKEYQPGLAHLPWISKQLRQSVREHLTRIVDRYYDQVSHGADVLDLFLLHEDFGRWGSLSARGTWWSHYFSPFASPTLVKLAFRLPAPIGITYDLHRTIIKRFLPKGYYWPPINEKNLVPLLGSSSVQERLGGFICRGLSVISRKLQKALNRRAHSTIRSLDQLEAEFFAHPLGDVIRDLLLSNDSVGIELFGEPNMQQMITDHTAGRTDYLHTLGALVTIEQWYRLVRQARKLADEFVLGN